MTLAGKPLQRYSSNRDVMTQFGPVGEERKSRPFTGDFDGVGPAVIYSAIDLEGKPEADKSNDRASEAATSMPAIDVKRARAID